MYIPDVNKTLYSFYPSVSQLSHLGYHNHFHYDFLILCTTMQVELHRTPMQGVQLPPLPPHRLFASHRSFLWPSQRQDSSEAAMAAEFDDYY